MYWNLLKRGFSGLWDRMFPRGLRRSSALPALLVVAIVGIPGLGYYLHMRGKFHTLKNEIKGEQVGAPVGPRPGGLDPMVLSRAQSPGSNMPEFRSVTLLPGLGMGVLQITATVPERGEIPLLATPSLEEMANSGSAAGSGAARNGQNDTRGALEAPWGGLLTGLLSPVGTTLRTMWKGKQIQTPTDVQGHGTAYGGILAAVSADATQTGGRPEGPSATATFKATDFNEHWVSKTDVTVNVTLGAKAIDVLMTARNVGDQPEPMGLGWHPRFVIPSGSRATAEVKLPSGDALETGEQGLPSGRIVAPGAGLARYVGHAAALGQGALDEALVHPKPALLDTGAEAEVRDPASGVGLKMTAISSSIREFRVVSPAGANYVGLGTQTNYDDPLGKEWNGADSAAIMTLMPGQTVEWKVRLEIFSVLKK